MADVLVVGAGPVGLTMAAELARHGVRSRIIDRLPAPSGYCKAIGVTPRTLEIWEAMGIVQPMIDAGLWLRGLRTILPGQKQHDTLFDLSDLPYGNLGIPQYATERILTGHLQRFGIAVERGVTLTGLVDDGRRVRVTLTRSDGSGVSDEAEFRFVIGCDGAHSAVRRAVGIGFPGDSFPMAFMLGDVSIDWDVPRGLSVFCTIPRDDAPPDLLVAIPLPERSRYRVSTIAADGTGQNPSADHGIMADRPGPPLGELQDVADRLLPGKPRLSDMRWSSLFRISMRLADRYRVGNVFVAGDAAHIHPPTGGQGMNTGIQDTYNLAWKLALVAQGKADERLLSSYEEERRPVGMETVERTREASVGFGRLRDRGDRRKDTQLLVNYRGSAIVEDRLRPEGRVCAGDRAPDCHGLRGDGIGFPMRLFDLLHGTAHLVVIGLGATGSEQQARLEDLACALERYGPVVRVIAIAPGGTVLPAVPGIRAVVDAEGTFESAYGAGDDAILVVRPDGHVGYRGALSDQRALDRYFERIFAAT